MFEEDNLVSNDTTTSAVDLIQSADVKVVTVAEVVKKSKARSVNLNTIVSSLQGITTEDLKHCTPIAVKELSEQATRINAEFLGIFTNG